MAATSNQTTSVQELSAGGSDGATFGNSTSEKIAFYGVTPIAQQTVTAVATAATLGDVVSTLQSLQAAIESLGLIADS
jgi:hypothetical protein